eukprot:355942-Amphidinium_carterae.1
MATTAPEMEETFTPRAPGPLPNEVDNNNPLAYHSSDTSDASDSTIDRDIRDNSEIIMWNTVVSSRCSPIVRSQLHTSHLILPIEDERRYKRHSLTILMREQVITMSLTPPIQLDSFTPMTASSDDSQQYLWLTWLTESQYGQFVLNGQVPGYKDTRGDN